MMVRADAGGRNRRLVALMMAMFFSLGFCTVLVDTLVPKFRAIFSLSYTEVLLTQFCFFGAYFIVSLPAGWLMGRVGYLRGMVTGLVLMATGAGGFILAALAATYGGFLAALFVVAAGVTIVQVAANPVTAAAGAPEQASSRLTLAQAFNSVATMLGPLVGAQFILVDIRLAPVGGSASGLAAFRQAQAHVFIAPFAAIGLALLILAACCWRARGLSPPVLAPRAGSLGRLVRRPRLMLGASAIFAYVGAEVAIGSTLTNYLMQPSVLSTDAATAGRMVSLYWGGAMLGRFAGFVVLRRARPGLVLALCAAGAAVLTLASSWSGGWPAAVTILAVGLCNPVMFPTIFTLAIEGSGKDAAEASGFVCLAIVGGAIVPLSMGAVADRTGLATALLVPVVCYLLVACFGMLDYSGRLGRLLPAEM